MSATEYRLDLHLFDGAAGGGGAGAAGAGAGSAGAAGAPGAGQAADTGVNGEDAAPVNPRTRRDPMANVRYGKQQGTAVPDVAAQQQGTEEAQAGEDPEAEWKNIRNGKYKAQFDADVQQIVQNRLKNSKQSEETLGKLAPVLQQLAQRYGVQDGDVDGLVAKFTDDNSLYEDEALQRGIPVETLKQIKRLEADQHQLEEMRHQQEQEQFFRQHIEKLAQQAEQLKQTYPQFDLRTELQNPEFARLTSPEVGLDVDTAFHVIHRREWQTAAVQAGAEQAARRISNAVQAGARRPQENGLGNQSGLEIRDDPRKLTRKDREEIRARVARGEKIAWD